jgi:hypothetical protein
MVAPLVAAGAAAGAGIKGALATVGKVAAGGAAIASLIDLARAFTGGNRSKEMTEAIVAQRDAAVQELVDQGAPREQALVMVNEQLRPELMAAEQARATEPTVAGSLLGLGASVGGLGLLRGGGAAAKAAFTGAGGGLRGVGAGAKSLGRSAIVGAPKAAAGIPEGFGPQTMQLGPLGPEEGAEALRGRVMEELLAEAAAGRGYGR